MTKYHGYKTNRGVIGEAPVQAGDVWRSEHGRWERISCSIAMQQLNYLVEKEQANEQ